jgi:hypothetical protein
MQSAWRHAPVEAGVACKGNAHAAGIKPASSGAKRKLPGFEMARRL